MNPAVSPWIILPLTLAAMLIVSAHVTRTQAAPAPASRRRLRVANGWIMLVTLPLLAAGVSLLAPESDPRLFVLTWIAVTLLLILAITIALLDAANTLRLLRLEKQRRLIEFIKDKHAADRSSEQPPGSGPDPKSTADSRTES